MNPQDMPQGNDADVNDRDDPFDENQGVNFYSNVEEQKDKAISDLPEASIQMPDAQEAAPQDASRSQLIIPDDHEAVARADLYVVHGSYQNFLMASQIQRGAAPAAAWGIDDE